MATGQEAATAVTTTATAHKRKRRRIHTTTCMIATCAFVGKEMSGCRKNGMRALPGKRRNAPFLPEFHLRQSGASSPPLLPPPRTSPTCRTLRSTHQQQQLQLESLHGGTPRPKRGVVVRSCLPSPGPPQQLEAEASLRSRRRNCNEKHRMHSSNSNNNNCRATGEKTCSCGASCLLGKIRKKQIGESHNRRLNQNIQADPHSPSHFCLHIVRIKARATAAATKTAVLTVCPSLQCPCLALLEEEEQELEEQQ